MSSVQCFRELINERLTAAAEEIFRVFQQTIVEYEKEIDRQRRLLDVVWKPEIKLHRTELPQQHVCKEEEILADQQLCNQESNSSLDQEDPEPPQIKEEQEELCTSLEGEQLVLMKQETETFMLTPTCEESDNSEDQTLDLSPNETQSAAEKEHVVSMSVKSFLVPEPNSDDQLLSHNSHVAESQDHKGGKHGDSGSTRNAEPKPQNHKHSENVCNSTNSHLNTHAGQKSLRCDTCWKSFKDKSKLNIHLRIHTGEKPYPCKTCGREFRYSDKLSVHMRTHTGEKPYLCNTCGKNFSDMSGLKRHMRIHTGEKPYPCKTCGKSFRHSSGLLVHMRTHTGEKPYLCNTCGKRYCHMPDLKTHMRIHTGEKPFTCKMCGRAFRLFGDLTIHTRRAHKSEMAYNYNT